MARKSKKAVVGETPTDVVEIQAIIHQIQDGVDGVEKRLRTLQEQNGSLDVNASLKSFAKMRRQLVRQFNLLPSKLERSARSAEKAKQKAERAKKASARKAERIAKLREALAKLEGKS